MSTLLSAFWFFLPAGVANMAPVLANHIPIVNRWQTPLDFGQKLGGRRIFGDNKTWRGVTFGTLAGGVAGLLVYTFVFESSNPLAAFLFSAVMGFGALVGDGLGSFLKRQLSVKPGESWFPIDQLDYIVGGLLFIYPFAPLPLSIMVIITGLYFGLHLVVSYFSYLVGIKAKPM